MHRTLRAASLVLVLLPVLPSYAGSCEPPILAVVLDTVEKASQSGAMGRVLVAKSTSGEVRATLVDFTSKLHPKNVAEELLGDFQRRNAVPSDARNNGIDLAKYRAGDDLDWTAITRDYPDTQTIAELSRPGCDSTGAYGIARLRYYSRVKSSRPDSMLLHLTRNEKNEWTIGRVKNVAQTKWTGFACASDVTMPTTADFPDLCRTFAGNIGVPQQAGAH